MKNYIGVLILAMALWSVGSASAIDHKGKFAIGAYAGHAFGFGDAFKQYKRHYDFSYLVDGRWVIDESLQKKLRFCYGAKMKYGLTPKLALEVNLDYQEADWRIDSKDETDFFIEYSHHILNDDWTAILVNIQYILSTRKKTTPYITAGLGLHLDGDTEPGLNFGGGIEHFFQNNLALDADARFNMIFTEGERTTYLQIRAGLNYYFVVK